MRVVVIGGTNFIGPRVVRELAAAGHDVTVVHRGLHEADLPPSVRHLHCDAAVSLPDALDADVVIHMTAMGENDTRVAVEHFRRGRAQRLVLVSSGDVYLAYGRLTGLEPGPPVALPLTEDAPLRSVLYPYRHQAQSEADLSFWYEKILAERAAEDSAELRTTILRLPKVHDGTFAHLLPFHRRRSWRWTHGDVVDVADAITLAGLSETAAGRVYNVGEPVTPPLAERLRGTVIDETVSEPPDYDFSQDIVYDTTRIRRELGYEEGNR